MSISRRNLLLGGAALAAVTALGGTLLLGGNEALASVENGAAAPAPAYKPIAPRRARRCLTRVV